MTEPTGDGPGQPRMVTLVGGDRGVDLLGYEEPLLGDITLSPGPDLHCRVGLEVAVPIGLLAPRRDHYALFGGWVVADYLQRGPADAPALAALVGQQQDPVAEQPAK